MKTINYYLSKQTTFLPSCNQADWVFSGIKRRLFPNWSGWQELDFNNKSQPFVSDFVNSIFKQYQTNNQKSDLILLQILFDFGEEKLKWFLNRLSDKSPESVMKEAVITYKELGLLHHFYLQLIKLDK